MSINPVGQKAMFNRFDESLTVGSQENLHTERDQSAQKEEDGTPDFSNCGIYGWRLPPPLAEGVTGTTREGSLLRGSNSKLSVPWRQMDLAYHL